MEETTWNKLIKYINSLPIGTIISRPEICYAADKSPKKENTIDQYKRSLVITNILKPIERGKYQISYHINETLTPTMVRNLAYRTNSDNCLIWFNKISKGV